MTDIFNEIAERYDQTIALINSLDDWVYTRNLPIKRDNVLEIGCGSGHLLKVLSNYFRECCGIDSSKKMIELAQKKDSRFKLIVGNAEELPYRDEYFDYVVSHTTFHHLNQKKATEEVKRVLKRGGKFVLVDVVLEKNKFRKRFEKYFYKYLMTMPRMIFRNGIKKTIEAWKYVGNQKWVEHVRAEKHLYFDKEQFKDFYSKLLPGVKFGVSNNKIGYLVWEKA